MIKEALEYLFKQNEAKIISLPDGSTWANKQLELLKEIHSKTVALETNTLTSLVDLVKLFCNDKTFFDKNPIIHICSPTRVFLKCNNYYNWEDSYDISIANINPLQLNTSYIDFDAFILMLQGMFETGTELSELIQVVSKVTSVDNLLCEDTGISMNVTTKKGIITEERNKIKTQYKLAQYRSFPEISQPVSVYIFRIKKINDEIKFKLIPQADRRWEIDAINSIKNWFNDEFDKNSEIEISIIG